MNLPITYDNINYSVNIWRRAMAETRFEKLLTSYVPLPMCIVNPHGKVVSASAHIGEVFIYEGIKDADFFALTGIKIEDLYSAIENNKYLAVERNGKIFRLQINKNGDKENANLLVFFNDITNFENLKERYNDEKICIAMINVDNYDELIASTAVEKRMTISTAVDTTIRKWATKTKGSINKLSEYEYIMFFEHLHIDEMMENKFSILDEIRSIETEADFPVSLSIGVGIGGKSPGVTEEYASSALNLALGRGGDQAVVKRMSKIEYFGGKMQTVEKGNKGKSRVVAHALKQLIEQSKRVLIMAHKYPDMDAFGSALGIYRICQMCNKDAYIIINDFSEALQVIYKQAKETDRYQFIDNEKAFKLVDKETLIVVLDTHRVSYVECKELLDETDKIVVIDHHRRAEDCIENPTLSYIESYASSTCELVSEILQYSNLKKNLIKLEAEALLAGMTIDTNRFAVKTGVRTFESAAWLRRQGADTTEVKRFFQTDMETFKVRAKCIAAAEVLDSGVAVSICEGNNQEAQIINSQVADELLNIQGIKATFVAGKNRDGKTVVSARSLGDVNVQVIMEKFGGGGHLTTAGAQVEDSPEEVIEKLKQLF